MKRIFPAMAAAALGLTVLTACGGDGDDSNAAGDNYCEKIETANKQIDALEDSDIASLRSAVDTLHELADSAPSDLEDEWNTMTGAIDKIVQAFDDAGLDDEALDDVQSGKLPEGVDMSKLQDLMTAMQELDTDALETAIEAIQEHANDECGVDLGS